MKIQKLILKINQTHVVEFTGKDKGAGKPLVMD
jgi:hypothetical protein